MPSALPSGQAAVGRGQVRVLRAGIMALPLIAVLNGPNLNMLGMRQPEVYGAATLDDVEALCAETAEALDLAIDFRQTNSEGELVTWVQDCRPAAGRPGAAAILINPAGLSHTSVALLDALLAAERPVVEVHLSNIHRREEFRHHSYVSRAAVGVICGLGIRGYALGLTALAEILLDMPGGGMPGGGGMADGGAAEGRRAR